jgi:hypothetical protein
MSASRLSAGDTGGSADQPSPACCAAASIAVSRPVIRQAIVPIRIVVYRRAIIVSIAVSGFACNLGGGTEANLKTDAGFTDATAAR